MPAFRPFVSLLIAVSLAGVGSAQTPWNGSTYPMMFAGQLTDANCNNGPSLLQPASFTLIQSEILLLKAMGVKAISVEVSFPMLNAAFFNFIGQPQYQSQFTTFYSNVAAAIRAQGLQVIVESQSMIPTGLQSKWGAGLQNYYATLTTFDAYENARADTAALVAQTMRPDYFVLQEEPDTEAVQSAQTAVGTVSGSTAMLNGTITAVRQTNIAGMKIGAGFGSWLQQYQLFANSFTRQHCGQMVNGQRQPCISQALDFLDMHVFPITEQTADCTSPPNPKPCASPNFWQNAMAVVSTANAAGIPTSISQTWLRKVRDSEWLQIDGDTQEAREAYSFWAPPDLTFLQTIDDLANYNHMLFVVPFNTQNYSAYLIWSGGASTCTVDTMPACTALRGEGGGNSEAQVFNAVQSARLMNAAASSYTTLGVGFHNLIVSDTAAPSAPSNVVALRTAPASIMLSWTPSTDNVGVAGYHVLRNGAPLADTFQSPFQDSGLSPAAVYTYQVQAFDLAGNVSSLVTASQNARRRAVSH